MFRNILVAIDVEEEGSWIGALSAAEALAHAFASQLTLCTIVSGWAAAREAEWSAIGCRELIENARIRLLELVPQTLKVEVEVGLGPVDSTLLEIAGRRGVDLIVLASHKPHLPDYVLGSNARAIAGRAAQSVLVVRSPAEPPAGAA
jgi:nucleotide-binding universal stress UspA family protein